MTKMDPLGLSQLPHHTLKDMGNRSFSEARYQEAILYYTSAIKKQPNISSYYSNRALCYVQMQEYAKALPDCRRSIQLDESNLKAYFFAGQAHLGLGQWDEALAKLIRAHDLALEQHRNFGDDITSVIRLAKRKRFEALDEKRRQQEISLQVYLNDLIMQDTERKKKAVLSQFGCDTSYRGPSDLNQPAHSQDKSPVEDASTVSPSCALATSHGTTGCPAADTHHPDTLDRPTGITSSSVQIHTVESPSASQDSACMPPEVQLQLSQVEDTAQKHIAELNDLFAQVDNRRQKREVPDYLCGRISFELMLDPVITPSGITYDRRSIIAHLRKVGHFDPLSRQPLTENQLIPNLSMKEVIHAYLEENPWADGY